MILIVAFLTGSPFLCKSSNIDSYYYVFKFVNKSFFTAHEVKVELYKIRKIPMGGGKYNNEHLRLSIKNGEIGCVPKNPFLKRNIKDHPHCVIVRSFDNINSILEDEMNAVLLRISLKHGLSGLSSVFEHEYGNEGDIKNGRFTPGSKFDNI